MSKIETDDFPGIEFLLREYKKFDIGRKKQIKPQVSFETYMRLRFKYESEIPEPEIMNG